VVSFELKSDTLICILLITSFLPLVNSTDENNINYPHFEVTTQNDCECTKNPSLQISVQNECGCNSQIKYSLGHNPVPDWVVRTPLPDPTGLLPTDLDWRNNGGDYTTPAKNQGNCGCLLDFCCTWCS
jgi:hypothetical protein